jgi:hypothetical protein
MIKHTLLVSAAADKSLKLWGLDFGDLHKSFLGAGDAVTAVAPGALFDDPGLYVVATPPPAFTSLSALRRGHAERERYRQRKQRACSALPAR